MVPALTGIAASGASYIWTRRSKSLLYRFASLALIASVLGSFAASTAMAYISSLNYPGGTALARLHALHDSDVHSAPKSHLMQVQGQAQTQLQSQDEPITVYLDNLSCQTGITRFLQNHSSLPTSGAPAWIYDKTNDPTSLLDPTFWAQFQYVLAEEPARVIGSWEVLDTIEGYGGVGLTAEEGQEQGRLPGLNKETALWRTYALFVGKVKRFTGGRWPFVRMVPKLHVLKRQGGMPVAHV